MKKTSVHLLLKQSSQKLDQLSCFELLTISLDVVFTHIGLVPFSAQSQNHHVFLRALWSGKGWPSWLWLWKHSQSHQQWSKFLCETKKSTRAVAVLMTNFVSARGLHYDCSSNDQLRLVTRNISRRIAPKTSTMFWLCPGTYLCVFCLVGDGICFLFLLLGGSGSSKTRQLCGPPLHKRWLGTQIQHQGKQMVSNHYFN